MKVFFSLLLILNIGFAVFQWLMPSRASASPSRRSISCSLDCSP